MEFTALEICMLIVLKEKQNFGRYINNGQFGIVKLKNTLTI